MNESEFSQRLDTLRPIGTAGFALAFQIEYSTPAFLFQTYPKAWADYYSQNGLVMSDPTVAWGFSDTGHRRWSDLSGNDPAGVMSKAAEFGLNYGATFATLTGGKRSIASFARSDREFTDAEIATLSDAVQDLHMATADIKSNAPELTAALKKMSLRLSNTVTE